MIRTVVMTKLDAWAESKTQEQFDNYATILFSVIFWGGILLACGLAFD